MKKINKSHLQHGGIAVLLTALVLVVVVIVNIIVATLAGRYEWMYFDMAKSKVYTISEDCKEYFEEYIIPELDEGEKIKLILCENKQSTEENISRKYIHDSFYDIQDLFPQKIEIEYLNIWEQPSIARSYGVTRATDVVCVVGDRHETMNLEDFYVFEASDTTSPIAYNGEKIIASCMMRVTQKTTPLCYITVNHGESFADYEFMRAMAEAGYNCQYLDLSADEIPENCDILVTFNPKQDFIAFDGVSEISEIDKLDEYMANGGKYMVFLSADTFISGQREIFEGFLSRWGVNFMHQKGQEGIEECYLIKDSANSLTVDGYKVISEYSKDGLGAQMLNGLKYPNVFGNTGCISFVEDFVLDGEGNYVNSSSGCSVSPLLVSHESAEAYAGGRAVARAVDDPFVLMSVSSKECENGKQAYLIASASTEFANEESMQSAVLGNSRTLTQILRYMGKENAPADLVFKPFESTEIESLTTATANTLSLLLAAIPAFFFVIVGAVVLIRRKNL